MSAQTRTVSIVGFQGIMTLKVNEIVPKEVLPIPMLIRLGYVGISIGDGKVYGFHPTQQEVEKLLGEPYNLENEIRQLMGLTRFLRGGNSLEGIVTDDTPVFLLANQVATRMPEAIQWIPTVMERKVTIPSAEYERIGQKIRQALNQVAVFRYSLPPLPSDCHNCVTWVTSLSTSLPKSDGVVSEFMKWLGEGFRWTGKETE